ncbi:hypothetical protein G3N57_26370 [Paraburkholderia sp. Se-20369]|nr:hypothetical protein [Paraburkholderia sp. Se-20369]
MKGFAAPRPAHLARTAGRLFIAVLCAAPLVAHALPSYDDVRHRWRSSDWVLLARDGTPLQRTRIDLAERRGDWVVLADTSPAFREAIVVSEDKRFYEHSGVDWRGIAGAAWGNLWNERTRGASTVTMQLAGLLGDSPRRSGQRSLPQKASQAMNALLLERGRRLLAEADELDRLFRRRDRDVIGRLNVDVPSRIARRVVAPALPSLFRRYPKLQLSLGSTDRSIDLVQEGVDCAIRVGRLADSSLVVRPLGQFALINCASPDYLRECGVPEHPDALAHGHWAIGYASPTTGRELEWEYCADGGRHTLALPSRVIVNNAETYIASCIAGMGLIQIPRFDVGHLLDSGALVEVMPGHRAAPMDVSAVYPHRRHRSRRLNAFIEWFEALMADALRETRVTADGD